MNPHKRAVWISLSAAAPKVFRGDGGDPSKNSGYAGLIFDTNS
ncbi:MAG: hypothetical protein ABSA83_10460 [Verrucomicrobiota bacterium]|jgi:hypothetical protein